MYFDSFVLSGLCLLLFLYGGGVVGWMWDLVCVYLCGDYCIFVFDFFGYGCSVDEFYVLYVEMVWEFICIFEWE